ncbi:hypothetical protein TNCV_4564741 [Trichonephila clavipes]|nr:hypothetical protein TNCV_4564741 [Trichonephila clavipes]
MDIPFTLTMSGVSYPEGDKGNKRAGPGGIQGSIWTLNTLAEACNVQFNTVLLLQITYHLPDEGEIYQPQHIIHTSSVIRHSALNTNHRCPPIVRYNTPNHNVELS